MTQRKIGDYTVVERLGHGAFGQVFSVKMNSDGGTYALKEIQVSSSVPLARLGAEVGLHKRLPKHNNVVGFVDYFQKGIHVYIVMELCELGTLEEYVVQHPPGPDTALSFMLDMTRGLRHLHDNNIVHRDIKTENILLVRGKHGIPVCKISDFGVSKIGTNEQFKTFVSGSLKEDYFSTVCGTPAFLAPEVETERYTKSCDIFSLGIIFYALHTSERTPENFINVCCRGQEHGAPTDIPFYRAIDRQIQQQVRKHIHSEAIFDVVCSMVKLDFKSRIPLAEVEARLLSQPDDEVFIVTCLLVAMMIVLLFFPLLLSLMIFALVTLMLLMVVPEQVAGRTYPGV